MSITTIAKAKPGVAQAETTTGPSINLDERQAAEYLSLSPRTLQTWRQRGNGPRFLKLGRSVRYRRADLDAFIESRVRANTSESGA